MKFVGVKVFEQLEEDCPRAGITKQHSREDVVAKESIPIVAESRL